MRDTIQLMEGNMHETPVGGVLVLGGTGFVGGRLVPELLKRGVKPRLLARNPSRVRTLFPQTEIEAVNGDLMDTDSLRGAMQGMHTAYYLVHSLGGRSAFRNLEFAEKDKLAARNFITAANREGLKRIIYLGALGEESVRLSEHLRSKAEVGKILSSGKPQTTILRSAIVIGAGGSSFEMLRYLVERLPVMVCPRWVDTKIQPIAIDDVIEYLSGCLQKAETAGRSFDICGPEIFSYEQMMQAYAEARGLPKRIIMKVPFLTPLLSAYWVDLVTPVPSGVAHPLIEGMVNDVVCRNNDIDQYVQVRKTSFRDAVLKAVSEEREGPGVTGF